MLLKQWTCLVHGFKILTSDYLTPWEPAPEDRCSQWVSYYFPEPGPCRFTPPALIDTADLPAPGTPEYQEAFAEEKARAEVAIYRRRFGRRKYWGNL